jgi:hypothetical protein
MAPRGARHHDIMEDGIMWRYLTRWTLLLACGALARAAEPWTAPAPKETMLIARVDVAAVRQSPLATKLLTQHAQKWGLVTSFFAETVGLEVEQVRELWFLAAQEGSGVALLRGTFDAQRLTQRFGTLPNVTPSERPGCSFAAVFTDPKKPTPQMAALLDAETLLVGDQPSVERFLAARADAAQCLPADHAALRQVATSPKPLCVVLSGDLSQWRGFDRDLAAAVSQLELTGEVTTDLLLTLSATTRTPAQAEAVANLARGLAVLKADAPSLASKPLHRQVLHAAEISHAECVATAQVTIAGSTIQEQLAPRR